MYYRIIANLGTEAVDVERVNSLIQISENPLPSFKPVIVDAEPEVPEGYYLAKDYKILDDGEVHLVSRLEKIVEEGELTDGNDA